MTVNTQINSTVEYLKSTVTLSSANIKGMYAAPVILIPAQGAHTIIMIHDVLLELVFSTLAYTGSDGNGSVIMQYGNTVHGAGPSALIINSIVTGAVNSVGTSANVNISDSPTNYINAAIYASNTTSAYATGSGTINCTIFYSIINTIT